MYTRIYSDTTGEAGCPHADSVCFLAHSQNFKYNNSYKEAALPRSHYFPVGYCEKNKIEKQS